MELVLQQNKVVSWQFEASKKFAAPKNLGEFIMQIPSAVVRFSDHVIFEVKFQIFWFLRRLIFRSL